MKKLVFVCLMAFAFSNIFSQDSIVNKKIIVGVKPTPPFIIKDGDSYKGISIDLWNNIAGQLNLEYEYKELILADIVSALQNNEIDICISPLTVTSHRLESFDFMQPFYITNLTVAIKRHDRSFGKKFFSIGLIKTFVLLIIILLVLGFLLWLAERKYYENKVKGGYGILHFILYLSRFKKRDADPVSKSGGLIAILWGFAIIFILSAYAVVVFFSLNVNKIATEISSVNDLEKFKIGVIKESAPGEYLDSKNITYSEFNTMADLLNALTNEEVEAIVHDEPIIKFHLFEHHLEENYQILPVKFNTQYYSFAVPQKSDLQYQVNPVLFKQIENNWSAILEKYNLNE